MFQNSLPSRIGSAQFGVPIELELTCAASYEAPGTMRVQCNNVPNGFSVVELGIYIKEVVFYAGTTTDNINQEIGRIEIPPDHDTGNSLFIDWTGGRSGQIYYFTALIPYQFEPFV